MCWGNGASIKVQGQKWVSSFFSWFEIVGSENLQNILELFFPEKSARFDWEDFFFQYFFLFFMFVPFFFNPQMQKLFPIPSMYLYIFTYVWFKFFVGNEG